MKHGLPCSGLALFLICTSCKQGDSSSRGNFLTCADSASHEKKAECTSNEVATLNTLAEGDHEVIHFMSVAILDYSAVDVSMADAVKTFRKKVQ